MQQHAEQASVAEEFVQFMDANPTVFHFTDGIARMLANAGFVEITERDPPKLSRGGKYYVVRNLSSVIAFEIGENFVPGEDGFAIIASHIDANRMCLKPTSTVDTNEGYLRLGAAVYGGPSLSSWWDRDLSLGGRVVVRTGVRTGVRTSGGGDGGGVVTRLVRLPGVIGSIPSLAPHFGPVASLSRANLETNMVPVVSAGLSSAAVEADASEAELASPMAGKHPLPLLRALAREANCKVEDLLELELELFSAEKPVIGGLGRDLLYCGRMDDRLCSYAAIRGLIESSGTSASGTSGSSGSSTAGSDHVVKMVALYDNEEIGSLTRTGGYNKLMEATMGLVFESLYATKDERVQSAANSVALSADVTHAVNPNYLGAYAEGHMPRLNTGMTVKQLGRFTSTGLDAAICELVSQKAGTKLQRFAPRSDTASGGTIGPMRAASLGIRTIDIGIPVLSMHSIREITGVHDIELGSKWFAAFFALSNELTQINADTHR